MFPKSFVQIKLPFKGIATEMAATKMSLKREGMRKVEEEEVKAKN